MPNAGILNRRILIQSPSTTQDASGQPAQVWTDVLSTWASIRVASGRDIYAASGFVEKLTHIVTIRYRPETSVLYGMRVLYAGRVFRIQAISDPTEGRREIQLLCEEQNDGR